MIGAAWVEKEKLHGRSYKINPEWKNKRNSVQRSDFSWLIFALWLQRKFEEIGKIRFNSVNLRRKST